MSQPPPRPPLSPERRKLLERLRRRNASASRLTALEPRRDRGRFPLTFSQGMMWYNHQASGPSEFDQPAYEVFVRGPMSFESLKRAVEDVVERHDVLRARFTTFEGAPLQSIRAEPEVGFGWIDLSGSPPEERRTAALEAIGAARARPFDLAADPLLRLHVARLDPQEHLVAIVAHHIVLDGFSFPTFLDELWTRYSAHTGSPSRALPPVALQLADYAAWQRESARGSLGAAQAEYWRRRLEGATPLDLPTDRPRASCPDPRIPFSRISPAIGSRASLDADALERVKELTRRAGATRYMTLLAALGAALGRRCRQDDLSLWGPYSHRDRGDTERMIGYMATPLPMRLDVSGDPTALELIHRARSTVSGAFSHPDMPTGWGRAVHRDLPWSDPLAPPELFRVSLNYLPFADGELRSAPGLRLEPASHPARETRIELVFFVQEGPQSLTIFAVANAELYEKSTLSEIVEEYAAALSALAKSPEAGVDRLLRTQ